MDCGLVPWLDPLTMGPLNGGIVARIGTMEIYRETNTPSHDILEAEGIAISQA